MSVMIQHTQTYQPFVLPSSEDIKNFMEHSRSDEADVQSYLGLKKARTHNRDDDRIFRSTPSPPHYRDLVELLHR